MLDYINIGKRIRHYRKRCGYTQEQLGLNIHTSGAYISNLERAVKKPSLENLADIADNLGVTINDIVDQRNVEPEYTAELRDLIAGCSSGTRSQIKTSLAGIINILEQND
jgi:transcriptional regulator with XRE-family HTH domain